MNVGLKTRQTLDGTEKTCRRGEFPCTAHKWLELDRCPAAWDASSTELYRGLHSAQARRVICRDGDLSDDVPVICDGWAASVVTLSDGSRQILSFLLPGDFVSTTLLFEPGRRELVEAITDVHYCTLRRGVLRTMLLNRPHLFEKLVKAWIDEKRRLDQLIVDLGRRTAHERVARLIMDLHERLAQRGKIRAETMAMEFPLRQHHIADATGLTPVHVSKVLSGFRRSGLITIVDRSLAISDPAGFRRVADMR